MRELDISGFNAHDKTEGKEEWLTPPEIIKALGDLRTTIVSTKATRSRTKLLTSPLASLTRRHTKRTVNLVDEEPAKRNGKARLSAYGIRAVAVVAGVSVKTASRAIASDKLRMDSLQSVIDWTSERKASV